VVAPPTVFLLMQLAKRNVRTPRLPIGHQSSALAVNAPTTNLTSYPEPVPACPPAPNTAHAPVKYFDDRKGFWRYGGLLASRTLKRGRQKGQTILLIETALHQHVTRNGDEGEWVH
jgi:hypothetical protein